MGQLSVHRFLVSSPTGDDETGLRFQNRKSACQLRGFPALELRDSTGAIPFEFREVGKAPQVRLRREGSAYEIFSKFRCDLGAARTAKTGRVRLRSAPNQSAAFVMHVGVSLCKPGIRGEARTVDVGPFEPTVKAAYMSAR